MARPGMLLCAAAPVVRGWLVAGAGPDPVFRGCIGCADSTYYPKGVALNGALDLCNCHPTGCDVAGADKRCQCGAACGKAKTAAACCEACITWHSANSSCRSWFFRGLDKLCVLKGCTTGAQCGAFVAFASGGRTRISRNRII